ncbi:MAG: divalent metal cation transporter [candidate division KSB1 bacterium]|nr:divalent metal cation transporter [candidate division KSB1 bacterium]
MLRRPGGKMRIGLPMVEERDPQALAQEVERLRQINREKNWLKRLRGYWSFSGPGWLQSAITLGAGSAGSSIFAGSVFGYKLLWVQVVGILLGVVVLSAIGHQTLVTRARTYDVFWYKLHPAMALLWGFNVLLASVVWAFPQYSLGNAVLQDMLAVAGIRLPRWPTAFALLAGVTAIAWTYGSGRRRGIVLFERILKYFLYVMILAFAAVVVRTGVNWGELVRGLFCFHLPRDPQGITIVLGGLGAAVGVNQTFLLPYSLLARGWGQDHRPLKNFDLVVSTFIPFVLATSLVVIACANTLHVRGIQVRSAVDVAHTLEPIIGLTLGRIVFSVGILSMCLTTAVLEMVIAGFVLSEMFGFELQGWRYRAATMVANIGVLGAFYALPFWLPVLTSSFNLMMLPIAYVGFYILQNRVDYLGEFANRGAKGYIWNALLLLAVFVAALGAWAKLLSALGVWPQ